MVTRIQNLEAIRERICQVRIELAQLRAMERAALQVMKIREAADKQVGQTGKQGAG
jgi:hypothetical protein